MEDFRLDQSGQEVQDILNGAAMQSDLTAETERATEAEQTLQGNIDAEATRAQGAEGTLQDNIDAEEARAKEAEKQNADDIDSIEEKIPSGASSSNKLATEEYVADAVATATATFRGTYNLVSDLHLNVTATEQQIAAALAGAISTADNNDYCFILVPTSSETPTEIKEIDRYKFNGTAWAFEYKLNNSGFTAAQWAAINSGITSGDVAKLAALPTNAQMTTLLAGLQSDIDGEEARAKAAELAIQGNIDAEETRAKAAEKQNADDIDAIEAVLPETASSENKVATESEINSLSAAIEAILLLIPSAATSLNKLADKAYVNSSIATATATFRGTYNLVNDLGLTTSATHAQIATALAGAILTADNNDYAFVQIPTSDAMPSEIAKTERYKFNGTAWEYEYDLNNSGFTADQWAAINSGITQALVTKLSDLPTNAQLTTELGTLTSGITTINQKIPSAASQANKLVDTAAMESYIVQVLDVLTISYNVTSTDGHVTLSIGQVDGKITSVTLTTSDIASADALNLKASQADLTALASRVTTAEGNITSLGGRMTTAEGNITSLGGRMTTAEGNITSLGGRMTTAEGNITSLTGRVSTNETDIANLQQLYNDLQQSKPVPVTALPETGQQQGVIYRLAGTTSYSDYMWNGSTWVLMATYNNAIDNTPTALSNNLVKSSGVYDSIQGVNFSILDEIERDNVKCIKRVQSFKDASEYVHAYIGTDGSYHTWSDDQLRTYVYNTGAYSKIRVKTRTYAVDCCVIAFFAGDITVQGNFISDASVVALGNGYFDYEVEVPSQATKVCVFYGTNYNEELIIDFIDFEETEKKTEKKADTTNDEYQLVQKAIGTPVHGVVLMSGNGEVTLYSLSTLNLWEIDCTDIDRIDMILGSWSPDCFAIAFYSDDEATIFMRNESVPAYGYGNYRYIVDVPENAKKARITSGNGYVNPSFGLYRKIQLMNGSMVFNSQNVTLVVGNIYGDYASFSVRGKFYSSYHNATARRYLSVPLKSRFRINAGTIYGIHVVFYDYKLNYLGGVVLEAGEKAIVDNMKGASFIRFIIYDEPTIQQALSDDWSIEVFSEMTARKTYSNPIIKTIETPDPCIWDGEDGYYYLTASAMDGEWSGSNRTLLTNTLFRSANLVDWEDTEIVPYNTTEGNKVIQAFGLSGDCAAWCPEVFKRKDGKYLMYITKPWGQGVAVLESDFPTFGYEYKAFLNDMTGMDIPYNTAKFIDPFLVYDENGGLWMFAGSSKIYRRRMNESGEAFADGSSWDYVGGLDKSEGAAWSDHTAQEGTYLYKKNGWWYLFTSSGQTNLNTYCLGVTRSRTLDGDFLNKNGDSLKDGLATQILRDDSGEVYSCGHNGAIITDKNNKMWLFYHAKNQQPQSGQSTWRFLCVDNLKWGIDGWPYFEGGKPTLISDAPQM